MKYYYIKRITLAYVNDGIEVEVFSPYRGKLYRPYRKLSMARMVKVCHLMQYLAMMGATLHIVPGLKGLAVEVQLR